jgi:hypothetical protein
MLKDILNKLAQTRLEYLTNRYCPQLVQESNELEYEIKHSAEKLGRIRAELAQLDLEKIDLRNFITSHDDAVVSSSEDTITPFKGFSHARD